MSKVYFIAGGGTAGHVNPALAIAEAIKEREADSRSVFFVTKNGVENEMTKKAGFEQIIMEADRLPKGIGQALKFGHSSLSGYKTCIRAIEKYKPDAVIGTGGFVCGPLLLAASKRKVPYLIHEQNAFPGRANRFFSKKASAVCISFESSREYFEQNNHVFYTGNPIKKIFFEMTSEKAREALNIPSEKFLVLIMGGSLGAMPINKAIIEIFKDNLWQKMKIKYPELMLAISTGPRNYQDIKNDLSEYDLTDVHIEKYLDSTLWLPASDLYVGRAGASSAFESAATGTATIFLPYPYAADNHQYYNAKAFSTNNAAILMEDRDFNGKILLDQIRFLIENRSILFDMQKKAKANAMPNSASQIVDVLFKYVL